jgi:Holliday junction resolvase
MVKKLTPETIVKRQIKQYLWIRGWFNFHLTAGIGSYLGLPDRIAIKDGRVLFIEIKAPKGVQSNYQKRFQKYIECCGGEYVLARSVEDVMNVIEGGM